MTAVLLLAALAQGDGWTEPDHAGRWAPTDTGRVVTTPRRPHKHPDANAYLRSAATYAGDVTVTLDCVLTRGRYVGCCLCFDPVAGTGYWLATGHDLGKYPGRAYVKLVRGRRLDGRLHWHTQARAPAEVPTGVPVRIRFRKRGDRLSVAIDGKEAVHWHDDRYRRGRVQLRFHNTDAVIQRLRVVAGEGDKASTRRAAEEP